MVNEEAGSGTMGTGLVMVTFRPPVGQSVETGPVVGDRAGAPAPRKRRTD